ncbi:hypothetical protein K8R14_02990 [bacterium]|nr:hypothetical protein [bacterium]
MKKITVKALLQTYLHLMCLITLVSILFSGAYLIQTGASYIAPLHFSYSLHQVNDIQYMEDFNEEKCYDNGEVIEIEGNEYCWNETTRQNGLVNSLSIFISMSLLFILHRVGIKRIKKKDAIEWIDKGYTFISLMIYSIVGVIAIPTASYNLINYFLTRVGEYSTQYAPAYSLGLLVLSLPLWYIFFKKTNNLKD